jgi:uncharacterized protein DUF4252
MRITPVLCTLLLVFSAILSLKAQEQPTWIPQGVQSLQQSASSKSDFALDHSMLILASKLQPDNEDLRRVIAGVSGVSVHRYRFSGARQYDEAALRSVNDEYHAAGWTRVLNKHEKDAGAGVTSVWVRLENNAVSNVAVLLAKANEVDFAEVSGSISPVDISHLGGHFGIPKIEGGVVVPNTERRP